MSALVRITTGIMPQHSRVGMSRAMAQFGEASGTVSSVRAGNQCMLRKGMKNGVVDGMPWYCYIMNALMFTYSAWKKGEII